jgi:hypothetical protein
MALHSLWISSWQLLPFMLVWTVVLNPHIPAKISALAMECLLDGPIGLPHAPECRMRAIIQQFGCIS